MQKAVVYHTISEPIAPLPSNTDISPARFETHLKWLSRHREKVVPLRNLLTKPAQKNLIAITFDDGYQDNLTVALPLLEKYNMPATVFIAAGFIGESGYLTSEDVIALASHPLITIGSHGLMHQHLTRLPLNEARRELTVSKQILEATINQTVDLLAYPYGDCNAEIERLSEDCGYLAAWSVWNGNNTPHSLWRIPLGRNDNLLRFIAKISAAYFPIKRIIKPPVIEKQQTENNAEIHRRA